MSDKHDENDTAASTAQLIDTSDANEEVKDDIKTPSTVRTESLVIDGIGGGDDDDQQSDVEDES